MKRFIVAITLLLSLFVGSSSLAAGDAEELLIKKAETVIRGKKTYELPRTKYHCSYCLPYKNQDFFDIEVKRKKYRIVIENNTYYEWPYFIYVVSTSPEDGAEEKAILVKRSEIAGCKKKGIDISIKENQQPTTIGVDIDFGGLSEITGSIKIYKVK